MNYLCSYYNKKDILHKIKKKKKLESEEHFPSVHLDK